jgi:hypothetical protein
MAATTVAQPSLASPGIDDQAHCEVGKIHDYFPDGVPLVWVV